jgi:hypothetical protein
MPDLAQQLLKGYIRADGEYHGRESHVGQEFDEFLNIFFHALNNIMGMVEYENEVPSDGIMQGFCPLRPQPAQKQG